MGIGTLTCTYSNGVLPITLVNFEGIKESNGLRLRWQTASEIGNDYFSIERSSDAIEFETIGVVKGSGFSEAISNYDFIDQTPLFGNNFYRLTQFDFDGSSSSSNVIAYRHRDAKDLLIKVINKQLHIYSEGSIKYVAIVGLNGRLITASDRWFGDDALDLSDLPLGIYAVKVIGSHGTWVEKFQIR